jgi:hypothetical protein
VPDSGPEFDPLGRSRGCAAGEHRDCGHVRIAIRRPVSRQRLASTIGLCRCSCHATCPLADRAPVPLTVWQQLCACPGAERQRGWNDETGEQFPSFDEFQEKYQRESQGRREAKKAAFEAARAAASGKTRAEVQEIYLAELRARGLDVPSAPILEADVDWLMGHPLRGLAKIIRAIRNPFSPTS